MIFDQVLSFFAHITLGGVLKFLTIVFLLIYLLFAFVLVKQTKVMIQTVEANISPIIYFISIVHLLTVVIILLFVIIAF